MKIILADVDPKMVAAYRLRCGSLPGVSIHHGSILDLSVSAVVSPANSFGFMDGGIDAVYTRFFGGGVQESLQNDIKDLFDGELPVGMAHVVATGHPKIPYLISAPTMRVPMMLINSSVAPYLAARAALLAARNSMRYKIDSVAIPGLGTGVGGIHVDACAKQVRTAIEKVILNVGGKSSFPKNWKEVQDDHQRMYRDHVTDLQHYLGE